MSTRIALCSTVALVLALPFWMAGPAHGDPFSGSFIYESSTPAAPDSGLVTAPTLPPGGIQRGLSGSLKALEAVPEPSTLILLGSAAVGLGLAPRWKRRRQK